MFDNACLVIINHYDPDLTRIHIRLAGDAVQIFAPNLKYEYTLLTRQIRRQLSSEYPTCFRDAHQFLEIGRIYDGVAPCIAWCGSLSFSFALPPEAVEFLKDGKGIKSYLCYDGKFVQFPRLDFSQAQKTLQAVAKDPKARRALSKALRNSFRWPNSVKSEIRFFWDGGKNFFWREYVGSTPGMCGGLIYSEYNGKAQYSMHT